MKINVFSYVFWPEQFLINEMSKELVQKGHEINVMTGLPNYPKGDFYEGYSVATGPYEQIHDGVKIRRYPISPRKKGFPLLMLNYVTHILGGFFTQYYLPKADWAFVFATSPITTAIPAVIWAKLNNAKVCIWLQDLWPDSVAAVGATSRKSFLYKVLGHVVRWIYKHTDLILIQSPGFADNLKEFGYQGPYYVVPNWAPGLDFKNANKPDWMILPQGKFTVTFAGNIGKAQGVDTVMGAAEKLAVNDNIQFCMVGDGSDLDRLKTQAHEKKLTNIHFFGRRAIEDMPGLFRNSDALLVTLKTDPIFARTIPSKVQAYMAAGKPIVASLDGVGSQVIQEAKCGFVGPTEDASALSVNILKAAQSSTENRNQLGQNARAYFEQHYEKDKVISSLVAYLEKHCKSR